MEQKVIITKEEGIMNKSEIDEFIEQMEELGDEWNEEQVERVYGDMSLEDAITKRRSR